MHLSPVAISAVTDTKVHTDYGFTGWDGGTPIREWQVGYGTDPNYRSSFSPASAWTSRAAA
jgi:hypothetical protein